MRNGISQSYLNFLQTCTRALVVHLYQFTSITGENDYFTDLDWDVVYGGQTWKSTGLRIDGIRRKTATGLEVDEQTLKIVALPSDTLFGGTFLSAAETGSLDGCLVTRYRAVWPLVTGNLLYDMQNNIPIQTWTMFKGYVSTIETGGQTSVTLKIKSPLVKLEINMPRNYYQPGCLWTLFDSGCTLLKSSFAVNGIVASGGNLITIPVSGGITTPTGADGLPNYSQGRILFTSGVNSGLLTLIDTNTSNNLILAYALLENSSVGDTFTYWPGCSKSYTTCKVKFANEANFRGFDKVPPVSVSI